MIQPTTKKKTKKKQQQQQQQQQQKKIYIYIYVTNNKGALKLRLRAVFFSWSVETNARYTQMTTHVTVGARRSSLNSLKMHFFRFRPLLR